MLCQLGVQRMSIEDTLYRKLDTSGYEGSASVDRSRRRNIQFEFERTPRNRNRSVISETYDLDVRYQRCPHVVIR